MKKKFNRNLACASIAFCTMHAYAVNTANFDYSLSHPENVQGFRDGGEENENMLTPSVRSGADGEVKPAVSYQYSHVIKDGAVSLDAEVKLNGSYSLDDARGVLEEFSLGGGNSEFNFFTTGRISNHFFSAGLGVTLMKYSFTEGEITTGDKESSAASFSASYLYNYEDKFGLGLKYSYYEVLSDSELDTVEEAISGGNTLTLRALMPVKLNEKNIYIGLTVVDPIEAEEGDPVVSIGIETVFDLF